MAANRPNPVSIEVLGDLAPQVDEQITEVIQRVRRLDSNNSGWIQRQEQYIKSRFGKRRKKTLPWPNAANFNVPLTDGVIRRWKPPMASLVLDADPVAFFVAQEVSDLDPARVVEPFFTWLFTEHMDTGRELLRLLEFVATRGHAYTREGWRYETESEARIIDVESVIPEGVDDLVRSAQEVDPEVVIADRLMTEYGLSTQDEALMAREAAQKILAGERFVKITYQATLTDRPDWIALDPLDVIVEQGPNPETADTFTVIHQFTEDELRQKVIDGVFPREPIEDILVRRAEAEKRNRGRDLTRERGAGATATRQQIRDFMDRRAGIATGDPHGGEPRKVVLWETFCRLDFDGTGVRRKAVLWYAPQHEISVMAHDYVMPFPEWPITLFTFEPSATRPVDSRGIPELLSELQRIVNAYHNARIDASQILLAPVLTARVQANNFAQQIRWQPGQIIPVQQQGDVTPLQQDLRILTGLITEEQLNQRVAENFIGTFDATINQLQNPAERRTAAEVNVISQQASNIFGLDARLFQVGMGRVFKKIWKLWLEWGPETTFFRVQGEPQPRLARKSEIDLEFDIRPAGSPSSTNKAFMLNTMERVLPIIVQDQTGRFDAGAFLEQYFKLLDPNIAKLAIRDPEQTQAAQAVAQAAQAVTGNENLQI